MELVRILGGDSRMSECLVKNLASFSLNRSIQGGSDQCHTKEIAADIQQRNLGMKDLIMRLALDQVFAK
jgi:hypothetical protein